MRGNTSYCLKAWPLQPVRLMFAYWFCLLVAKGNYTYFADWTLSSAAWYFGRLLGSPETSIHACCYYRKKMSSSLQHSSKVRLHTAGLNDEYFCCSSYDFSNCTQYWSEDWPPAPVLCCLVTLFALLSGCQGLPLQRAVPYKIFWVYVLRKSENVSRSM